MDRRQFVGLTATAAGSLLDRRIEAAALPTVALAKVGRRAGRAAHGGAPEGADESGHAAW